MGSVELLRRVSFTSKPHAFLVLANRSVQSIFFQVGTRGAISSQFVASVTTYAIDIGLGLTFIILNNCQSQCQEGAPMGMSFLLWLGLNGFWDSPFLKLLACWEEL